MPGWRDSFFDIGDQECFKYSTKVEINMIIMSFSGCSKQIWDTVLVAWMLNSFEVSEGDCMCPKVGQILYM